MEKMGARPTTMSGLSGLGDIMLTCYGNLSRNRSVGIRLGKGERLQDILASSPQVTGLPCLYICLGGSTASIDGQFVLGKSYE